MLVSEARQSDNSKIVTTSDEVFALLLIDNYLEKWKTAAAAGTRLVEEDNPTEADEQMMGRKRQQRKQKDSRESTLKKSREPASMKTGWSNDGIRQFNSLVRMMIKDNRACPQSKDMERELLAFCRTRAGLKNTGGNEQQEQQDCTGADKNALETAVAKVPVEAAWDSDDKDDLKLLVVLVATAGSCT